MKNIHILNVWQDLVKQANINLEGDAPDVADTVLVEVDKQIKDLKERLAVYYRQLDISYSRLLSKEEILEQAIRDVNNETNTL